MINPNAEFKAYGIVTAVNRRPISGLSVEVETDHGTKLTELGFIYHRDIQVGDRVLVTIGFSIVSDRYGIRTIRKTKRGVA